MLFIEHVISKQFHTMVFYLEEFNILFIVDVFKKQFLQPSSQSEQAEHLLTLSSKPFTSLEDYAHHARTQIHKSELTS